MTDSADIENENESEDNEAKWQRAHRELSRLAKARAGLDLEEGRWLLAALRSRTHVRLGFGSFVEYVERLFGYVPRLTQSQQGGGGAVEVGLEIAAMAACDSQHVSHLGTDGVVEPQRASQSVPPATGFELTLRCQTKRT
jgi:hypothetical protein